jgi:2-oxoglutarate dehydrogenase complex dehydrogenase (E1) component-like enzyme
VKENVKRLVLTSGKVYYELAAKRAELGSQDDIAIVRVEQV